MLLNNIVYKKDQRLSKDKSVFRLIEYVSIDSYEQMDNCHLSLSNKHKRNEEMTSSTQQLRCERPQRVYALVIVTLVLLLAVPVQLPQEDNTVTFSVSQNAEAAVQDFRMRVDLVQDSLQHGTFTFYMGNVEREDLVGALGVSASISWQDLMTELYEFKNGVASWVELIGISLDFLDGWIEIARGADRFALGMILGLDEYYLDGFQTTTLITTDLHFDPGLGAWLGELGLGDDTIFKMGMAIEIDFTLSHAKDVVTMHPLHFLAGSEVSTLLSAVGFDLEVTITTPAEYQIETTEPYWNHYRTPTEKENLNFEAADSEIRIVKQPLWFSSNFMLVVLLGGAIASALMRSSARKKHPHKEIKSSKTIWVLAALFFFWPIIAWANYLFYLFVIVGLARSAGTLRGKPPKKAKQEPYSSSNASRSVLAQQGASISNCSSSAYVPATTPSLANNVTSTQSSGFYPSQAHLLYGYQQVPPPTRPHTVCPSCRSLCTYYPGAGYFCWRCRRYY